MPRPFELAGTRRELPVAAACGVGLIAIFVGDIVTPADVILTALAIFPLMFGVWTLGRWPALALAVLASALLVLEAIVGSANDITVGVEVVAYGALAGLTRLYARRVAAPTTARISPASPDRPVQLTRREREVVALAAHGWTASEIGDLLHIGQRTVETHLANAYPKLGVRSKLELVREAARLGV